MAVDWDTDFLLEVVLLMTAIILMAGPLMEAEVSDYTGTERYQRSGDDTWSQRHQSPHCIGAAQDLSHPRWRELCTSSPSP